MCVISGLYGGLVNHCTCQSIALEDELVDLHGCRRCYECVVRTRRYSEGEFDNGRSPLRMGKGWLRTVLLRS